MSSREINNQYNYDIDKGNHRIKGKSMQILEDLIILNGEKYNYYDVQFILVRAGLRKKRDLNNGDILVAVTSPPKEHLKGYIEIQFLDKMYRFINEKDVMEKYVQLAKKVSDIECYYVCDDERALYKYNVL